MGPNNFACQSNKCFPLRAKFCKIRTEFGIFLETIINLVSTVRIPFNRARDYDIQSFLCHPTLHTVRSLMFVVRYALLN